MIQIATGITVPILCAAKLYYSFHEELALVKRDIAEVRETQMNNVIRLQTQAEQIVNLQIALAKTHP